MMTLEELREKLLEPLRDSAAAGYVRQARMWIEPRYRELRSRYYKLEKRERRMVQFAAGILVLFLAYNLVYLPVVSYQAELQDEVATRERDLTDVRRMTVTYKRVRTELIKLERSAPPSRKDFSISSLLSTALDGAVASDKIGGISTQPDKPISGQFTEYSASLRLNNVSLTQLVNVLYKIKTIKTPVVVSNLGIKKNSQNPHAYDVDMICSVLGKNA